MRMMLRRVAVVGAGAAGLCAARHVLSRPNSFAHPVVFELSDNIGGTWCYEECVGAHDNGRPVHSSMYRDLRTNLPKEVMMFPEFPFDPQLSSFLPHQEVQKYLERYCQSHNIRPHIRFNTVVDNVKPVVVTTEDGAEETTWEVTSSDASGRQQTATFDSVFVCSGHYSDPHIPKVPGIQNFKGKVLHSHSYRFAEMFSGQSVVVLGAKASGLDISIELAKAGAKVTLSHGRPQLTFPLPSEIRQSCPVAAIEDDGSIRFQDGSLGRADVLMFCTGYNFKYPFLDAEQVGLEIQHHMVSPLYRFLMPPAFPSLVFIGICKMICPFPNFDCQVQFALAVLDGSVTLPSRAEMEDEVRRELQEKVERGVEQRHLLVMDKDQWEYLRALAHTAGFPPLPPVVRDLYVEVWRQRQVHPENYRRLNYRLVSDTEWELIE
ncbi:putative flavin-containing monooxygenase FMO GS-OX4-like [Scophthalmus maximus]|uniref:Flavin-containing monooxygenase n=1 Tax=Scophthalmus maximus TaxID=52904 RepID=A0A2U9B6R8_SCOMX|nr:dimethylaniline monooxygenase [N-oxide-forming] 3 [Scophthalmus maximus]XP_035480406.1 dimethylaniline monooxygenase [N-oxide-forming] 3 [Scophthalmus maximus]XP_035480407.1 dimethylaniline monooxygenase [N-oxide-forming] 3 [Scophthalmus maximus]XP_035480409.1 dimethylaniline monooxygenase [N-oxide-forming] 3 [Scophthalmus maximus]AWO99634.1 putative flavin-containing monooxygenase FMO GS-OX4-like [Scophthalmus maximus]